MKNKIILFAAACLSLNVAVAQNVHHDQLQVREYKPGFYDKDIMKGIEQFESSKKEAQRKPSYKIDVTKINKL